MSQICVMRALLGCVLLMAVSNSGWAQHEHGSRSPSLHVGAQGVGLVTHASPATLGESLTEGYLTQPMLMAMAQAWRGHLTFQGVLNLEGLTLKRGELNHGVWGEGYIDRRHPHTYLHEAIVTANGSAGGLRASISAGKGFVPFGTDDPMSRPFVKFPANHHLSQALERLIVTAAARTGPVALEAGAFNGDEPINPASNGTLDRVGDSWSARATVFPIKGVEVQSSYAFIASPEQRVGGGLDHSKTSFSARLDRGRWYGLIEQARTAELHGDQEVFVFRSTLVEAAVDDNAWTWAARFERSTRPEEERTQDLFRSVRPTTDNSILGQTRFQIVTGNVSYTKVWHRLTLAPFVEVSRIGVKSLEAFPVYPPRELYGDDHLWHTSMGLRVEVGMKHNRMGRYGAALN